MKGREKLLLIVCVIGLIFIDVFIIPKTLKKYGNRKYKASLKKESIDFDNLGPKIVKKEDAKES